MVKLKTQNLSDINANPSKLYTLSLGFSEIGWHDCQMTMSIGMVARFPDMTRCSSKYMRNYLPYFVIKTTCWWGWGSNGGCMS